MDYPIIITPQITATLQALWGYNNNAVLLDITAFGDFFIRLPNNHVNLYSITDGSISDVTELVAEFGLPPVNLDLGDEWYQLGAQALLKQTKMVLPEGYCFGFKVPLFSQESVGIYGPENIEVIAIEQYHQRVMPLIENLKTQ